MRNKVRELRAREALSRVDLAAPLGVARQAVNSIETERSAPSPSLAGSVARFFDTSVERIFIFDGSTVKGQS